MTAKTSPEMLAAMRLVREGLTPYAAAKLSGVTKSAIYRSRLYLTFKEEQKNAQATPA